MGVTGGRYRDLPDEVDGFAIRKVDEIQAVGLGGLSLAGAEAGLVVSAGTGTAMVAARQGGVHHVTGSAVGGGTLLGLSKLILETDDVHEIDRLAMAGDASKVDIMLNEAVGGEVGRLPAEANAVNLGRLERGNGYSREDLAAGLVRLVAQVIAVIAINAADAEDLDGDHPDRPSDGPEIDPPGNRIGGAVLSTYFHHPRESRLRYGDGGFGSDVEDYIVLSNLVDVGYLKCHVGGLWPPYMTYIFTRGIVGHTSSVTIKFGYIKPSSYF